MAPGLHVKFVSLPPTSGESPGAAIVGAVFRMVRLADGTVLPLTPAALGVTRQRTSSPLSKRAPSSQLASAFVTGTSLTVHAKVRATVSSSRSRAAPGVQISVSASAGAAGVRLTSARLGGASAMTTGAEGLAGPSSKPSLATTSQVTLCPLAKLEPGTVSSVAPSMTAPSASQRTWARATGSPSGSWGSENRQL